MLGFFPILSRPSLLTFKNNWSKQSFLNKQFLRDILVLSCVVYLLFGLYKLSTKGFGILYRYHDLTSMFLPSVFNALIFTTVALAFFSACTFSLTNFYLSEDLDLILASPISKLKFFLNKFLQIFISSTWIIYVSSIPCIIAAGSIYQSDSRFYIELASLSLPLLILPVASAIICTTLVTRYLSGNHLRILLPTMTVFLLLTVFSKSHTFFSNAQKKDIRSVMDVLTNLDQANRSWLQFSTLGNRLSELLLNHLPSGNFEIAILYAISFTALCLSYFCIANLHGNSLTRIRSSSRNLHISSKHSQKLSRVILPFVSKPTRAVLLKEFKIFARDFSHLIQISVILIICLFYLYNFQTIFNARGYLTASLVSWQYMTFICNIAFGTLIITSLCTRFVYSCIPLEGKSFWILHSSPHSLEQVVWNKFKAWYFPVLLFSVVIFVSGCFALQSEIHLIILTVVTCAVTTYSTTALGVGLGSIFANFNWVHSAQIFASSGSLIFIFSSLLLTGVNLFILTSLLFMNYFSLHMGFSWNVYIVIMALLSVLFVIGNYLLGNWLIKKGAEALKKKIT